MIQYQVYDPAELDGRTRYQLLTSIVVPRPIGWISTWSEGGLANLAPFSYFAALSASPVLVGVSIGHRKTGPKDTLVNIRAKGAFCANFVSRSLLSPMNDTSGDYPPEVDEFEVAGLERRTADRVDAPFVDGAPTVMECRVFREVDLGSAPNTLVIGEVMRIHVDPAVPRSPGTEFLDTEHLDPVARLWGPMYGLLGDTMRIPRP
ncbi:MAG: flavin reductase family protein [Gemmatimonadetes bacterium]|nr:flavin reductase family protein [Gemmatimonadota bacterium]